MAYHKKLPGTQHKVYLIAILDKSTGNIINVDGGVPDAFVR